jgi:hypothetical protein
MGDHEINAAIYNEIIQGKAENFGFSGFGLVGTIQKRSRYYPGYCNQRLHSNGERFSN